MVSKQTDAGSKQAICRVIAILCLAFAVRVATASWWQARLPAGVPFGFGDSDSYWELARSISQGGPFRLGPNGPAIFRTPGYPMLLAPLFRWSGTPPVMWARVEGAALGTVAVGLTMWLARALFSQTAAYVAGSVSALYPGAVATSIFVLSEAPYCPLLMAQLACWVAAWKAPTRRSLSIWAILGGLAAGAATLVRPSHLLFTPFAVALTIFAASRRRNIVIGVYLLAGLALSMSPWWYRNYQVTGKFVATTLQMGASLYDGLNPDATGASNMEFVTEFTKSQLRAEAASASPLAGTFEERLDARFRSAAVDWARTHPRRVVELAVNKFMRMWSPWPNASEFQGWSFRVVVFLGYTPVMLAAAWGAWRHARRGWPWLLCLVPAVYLTLLHLVFVGSIRYREPAMLPLIVLAAGAWHRVEES